ncbi:alpha/beta hydrolase [Ahrensia marina]|uniref:Serine aminopeptidase S33 domain-containing protein n=1 Tax=Ahrensia marina TaxID=1514904 RepID=A0A0N0E6R7_9HYPH|nr:alpha/beta hydrolase [Ahrensia marina]KPB00335.1 hypothetical protein SU32_14570 [Ahrensia marina]
MTSLLKIASNLGPEPDMLDMLETDDGFKIRFAVFKSKEKPNNGTIILLQGRNEAIEKYLETIAELVERGFDVVTFDWRGQGGSTRFFSDHRRGHIDSYEQYSDDLEYVFQNIALPECRAPFYIVAHSTGSLVALYCAPRLNNRVRRMLLSSPFLGVGEEILSENQVIFLSSIFTFLGLGAMHMGGSRYGIAAMPFEKNRVTTDRERYARNQELMNPSRGLGLGSATATWLHASMKAVQAVRQSEHMAQIHIPVLLINAGADRVVSRAAVEDYAHRIRSGSLITIDGARHELMQEADTYREQFFAALDAFIPGSPD